MTAGLCFQREEKDKVCEVRTPADRDLGRDLRQDLGVQHSQGAWKKNVTNLVGTFSLPFRRGKTRQDLQKVKVRPSAPWKVLWPKVSR